MVKTIIKILGIVLLTILQLAFFSKLTILGAIPNTILIFAVTLTLKNRFQDALLLATIGSLLLDLASPLRFGIYAFLIIGIILIIENVILKVLPPPDYFFAFIFFAGAILVLDLGIGLFALSWPRWILLSDPLLNGLCGILILSLFGKIIRPENEIKVT